MRWPAGRLCRPGRRRAGAVARIRPRARSSVAPSLRHANSARGRESPCRVPRRPAGRARSEGAGGTGCPIRRSGRPGPAAAHRWSGDPRLCRRHRPDGSGLGQLPEPVLDLLRLGAHGQVGGGRREPAQDRRACPRPCLGGAGDGDIGGVDTDLEVLSGQRDQAIRPEFADIAAGHPGQELGRQGQDPGGILGVRRPGRMASASRRSATICS